MGNAEAQGCPSLGIGLKDISAPEVATAAGSRLRKQVPIRFLFFVLRLLIIKHYYTFGRRLDAAMILCNATCAGH